MNSGQQIRWIDNFMATNSDNITTELHFKAVWPSPPRQQYCWRLCSMWAALHPHSADDFLLSALNWSSFFSVSFSCRRQKVRIQIRGPFRLDKSLSRRLGEESTEILEGIKATYATLIWQISVWNRKRASEHAQGSLTPAYNSQWASATFLQRSWQKVLKICSDS